MSATRLNLPRGWWKNESKVYVNGYFIEPIKQERGVHQGFPLSALLFILSTQPFMLMIKNDLEFKESNLTKTNSKHMTCKKHDLFANKIEF